jgi:hypothetical protein
VKAPINLSRLNQQSKVLVVVDAVNIIKNLLVRTYVVGNNCQNRNKITKSILNRVFDSFNLLVKSTGLNLLDLIKESRRNLTRFEIENETGLTQLKLGNER